MVWEILIQNARAIDSLLSLLSASKHQVVFNSSFWECTHHLGSSSHTFYFVFFCFFWCWIMWERHQWATRRIIPWSRLNMKTKCLWLAFVFTRRPTHSSDELGRGEVMEGSFKWLIFKLLCLDQFFSSSFRWVF